jgi:Zn-dependent peptidase ImmA (M78 family)/transcriptional regulator with XRE-family HTH domain
MTVRAIVKPELLRWARESAAYTVDEAAKKARVTAERLTAWEEGERQPTVKQLRKLAGVYKRPLAVFYLPAPPRDFQAMHDFRQLPGTLLHQESPQLRAEIRKARFRREIALTLLEVLGEQAPPFDLPAELAEDAESVATRIRNALGVDFTTQSGWQGAHAALNAWRAALEAVGMLVFQFTGVELEEARGFSFGDLDLPVIACNVKDSPRGRIFTILHEMVHVMLHRTGLCDLQESSGPPENRRIEVFCNRVAGAAIVPARHLLSEPTVEHHQGTEWSDEDLTHLANRFGASRETILRRLVLLGRADEDFYRSMRARFLIEYRARLQDLSGGPSVPVKTLSQVGQRFARLVLDGYHQEKITSADVASYLGVRLKHMPRIEREVLGRQREFGAVA